MKARVHGALGRVAPPSPRDTARLCEPATGGFVRRSRWVRVA
ncbi:Hypothetical protein CAP_1065 [Chondromyces apiculatus DSM 436]|uniref:Uncharacterized protein n=1 Tax=Chondromyces apiculatus DSM 436 TaxID=1192034 RepID=A0A017STA1_9BACT|nr:Hypothetical protein CAP_1065 [Chondromyces apiculatus DSM 436]